MKQNNSRSSKLRKYEINTPQYYLYKDMHKNQTLNFVRKKKKKYSKLNNCKMNIKDVLLVGGSTRVPCVTESVKKIFIVLP